MAFPTGTLNICSSCAGDGLVSSVWRVAVERTTATHELSTQLTTSHIEAMERYAESCCLQCVLFIISMVVMGTARHIQACSQILVRLQCNMLAAVSGATA